MSVPKGQQSDGKLLVNELARDLAVYTIRITSNPKVFFPQYQTAITNEIIRCATNIHTHAWAANNVMVRNKEQYSMRRKYQELAALECNNLISLIDIAKPLFHLEDCKDRLEELLREMGFEFNQKKTRIYKLEEGIEFLGFTFRLTESGKVLRLISAKNVKMQRKKLVRLVALCKSGKYPRKIADDSYRCWRAHAAKGDTWKLLVRMDKFYFGLWRNDP